MTSKVNYAVVGLFVIILGAALIITTLWLSSNHSAKNYNTYLVFMNEAVAGLSEQSPVEFNGVKVGFVQSIQLNTQNLKQVILTLKIESDVPVTTSTTATLKSQGITGLTYIGLSAKSAQAPLLMSTPNQPYPVIKSEPSFLVQLDTALREVTTNVKELSKTVSQFFDEKNRKAITNTLNNLDKFSAMLANNSDNINKSLENANKLLKNASIASKDLPQVIDQLKATLTSIEQTSNSLNKTGKSATIALNDTRDVMRNVANQTMPSVNQMLNKLNIMLDNVTALSEKLNQNPSILIRGQQPQTPGPGERP